MSERSLTQRVDAGEVTIMHLDLVRWMARPEAALSSTAAAMSRELEGRAILVDEANRALWIERAVVRELKAQMRAKRPAAEQTQRQAIPQMIAEKQRQRRELLARQSRTAEEENHLAMLTDELRDLCDRRRGYRMPPPGYLKGGLARAWFVQRPMPGDLP